MRPSARYASTAQLSLDLQHHAGSGSAISDGMEEAIPNFSGDLFLLAD